MEARCTRLLKQLKAYAGDIDSRCIPDPEHCLLKDVAATAGGDVASVCYRVADLLKELKTAAKTSKVMREQFLESLDASTDEGRNPESIQETAQPSELSVEKNVSMGEDKITEPLQETPLPSSSPVELNITIHEDDEISECSQKNLSQLSESLADTSEERKTFHVLMDVSNFKPKELYVKIIGKHLVVYGEHEELFDEHGKVSRKFTRKFDIPEDVDTETFRALIDCYKVLTIEASLKSMNEKDGAFDVPIYEEDESKHILRPFKSLGPEFLELAETHIKDGELMRNFARKLAKQSPSDYIPIEEVLSSLI